MAVIVGTCNALRDKWQHFSDADRASMLNRMEACAVDAAQHLLVVARGGTPELVR